MRYQCTECDKVHRTFNAAAQCHWGIGGVIEVDEAEPTATITRSAHTDGAFVVFIDTEFEPDGSDDGPGLRVVLNDSDIYVGVPIGVEP